MTQYVRVVNVSRGGGVLAEHAEMADNPWTRFWGLMGRRQLPAGSGLVLSPGGSIHMFFMRLSLDVVHTGKDGRVTHVLHGIKPWRIGPLVVGTGFTVELPPGAAATTEPGDEIRVETLSPTR